MGKHTKAFAEQYWKGYQREPSSNEAEDFVMKLSKERTDMIISKIISETKRTYTTNKEIYKYCKKHNIGTDYDPYDNYGQSEIDFTPKKIDYSTMKSMDDVTVKGRKGFVVSNDKVGKVIIIEFEDNEEMEVIEY